MCNCMQMVICHSETVFSSTIILEKKTVPLDEEIIVVFVELIDSQIKSGALSPALFKFCSFSAWHTRAAALGPLATVSRLILVSPCIFQLCLCPDLLLTRCSVPGPAAGSGPSAPWHLSMAQRSWQLRVCLQNQHKVYLSDPQGITAFSEPIK